MAIKSIVEMKAQPGRRHELLSTLQQMQMSAGDAPGFIAAQRVLSNFGHVDTTPP